MGVWLLFGATSTAPFFLFVGFGGGATTTHLFLIFGIATRGLGTALFVFHKSKLFLVKLVTLTQYNFRAK